MASPYDILIDIRAKADEVQQAVAAIGGLVDKAASTGGVVSTAMAQGQAATQAFTRDIAGASAAAGQMGTQITSAAQQGGAAVNKAAESAGVLGKLGEEAGEAWKGFGSQLKESFTLGFGTELAEKAIETIGEIPRLFAEGITKGVEFNAEVETLGVGLAGALRQAQPEKYLNFAAARSAADQALTSIQGKANALGLDFRAVGEAVQSTMVPLVEGGIRDINQQIEVMTLLMQASASKGVTGFQAQRDAMDILAGRAESVNLGRELGISNEDIKREQQAGTLYDYLVGKLGAYREAGEAAAQTFNGLWASVQSLFAQLQGSAAAPVFDELKDDLSQIKATLDSLQARGAAQGAATVFTGLIAGAKELYDVLSTTAKMIYEVSGWGSVIRTAAAAAGDLSGHPFDAAAYAAQLEANQQIVESLRQQAVAAKDIGQQNVVRVAVVKAIANAQEQATSAEGDQKTAADTLLTALRAVEASIGRVATGHHQAAAAAGELTTALINSNRELGDMLAKLPALIDGMRQAAHAADIANQMAAASTATEKIGIQTRELDTNIQFINDKLSKLGLAPVSNLKELDATLVKIRDHATETHLPTTGMLSATAAPTPGVLKADADPAVIKAIADAQTKAQTAQNNLNSLTREQTNELRTQAQETDVRNHKLAEAGATSKDELDRLKEETRLRTEYYSAYNKYLKQGADAATADKEAQRDVAALKEETDKERAWAAAKKDTAAATRQAAQAARDERNENAEAEKNRNTAIQAFRDARADLKADPFQTDEQKLPQELKLLNDEREALLANVVARDKYIAAHQNDPKFAVPVGQAIGANVKDGQAAAQIAQQQRLLTITGQVRVQTQALQHQWGTTAQAIGTAISQITNDIVEGLSNAITGLIEGTKSWGQAFAQVGQAIIATIIKIIVQQTIGRAVMFLINLAFGKAEGQAAQQEGQAALQAWSPAAIAASIASYGIAAGAGLAAYTAAIAAGTAGGGMVGAFAEGGIIPGKPSHKDNTYAHVATGEFIHRTKAVEYYGVPAMHALNEMRIPREHLSGAAWMNRLNSVSIPRTGFATGGLVGANDGYTPILATVSGGNPNVSVGGSSLTLIQTRDRSEMLQALQSTEGKRIVLGHVKVNRTTVGIRS